MGRTVKPANKRTQKAQRTKHNDRAAEHQRAIDDVASGWELIKERYPEGVVELVDKLVEQGFTLNDLLRLELLEHFRIDGLIKAFVGKPKATTMIQALSSVMLQCRKHMRVIKVAMGEGVVALGNAPVKVPEGMRLEDFDAALKAIEDNPDEIMS